MFNRKLQEQIRLLEEKVGELQYDHSNCTSHSRCYVCGIMGHTKDMYKELSEFQLFSTGINYNYYHYGCYAKTFNKHLCPCKCGKWIDNKKKKCKTRG